MITTRLILLICTAGLLGACASKGPGAPAQPPTAFGCPVASSRIGAMEDLIESKVEYAGTARPVTVKAITCSLREDLLRIDVELENKADVEHRTAYKFRWLDRQGLAAWDEETLKPLLLYAHSARVVTGYAPAATAVDFRLFMLPQDK